MELRSGPLCFSQCGQDKGCVCVCFFVCFCVGVGGSGSDATDVGHVIQMGIKGGVSGPKMVGSLGL